MSNQAVVAELKRIAAENGGVLNPAAVVLAAQPVDSVLHSRFEWDDTEAAHNYRMWQARQLIRITVEIINVGDKSALTNVFVSLTPDRTGEGGYRTMVSILSDKQQRDQMLADAYRELELFQEKYRELKELADVFAAIQAVAPTPTRPRRRARGLQPQPQA